MRKKEIINSNNPSKTKNIIQHITVFEDGEFPNLDAIDLVLVGCGEERGLGMGRPFSSAADTIREEFYKSFYWHQDVSIADIGNIKAGDSLNDSYAALKLVIKE